MQPLFKRPAAPSSTTHQPGCLTYAIIAVALIAGLFAGDRWGDALQHRLGLHDSPAPPAAEATEGEQLWTCSMHPQVIQKEPGVCPICHMALEPLKAGPNTGHGDHAIQIDPAVVQNMGVRTATAARGALRREIRAAGFLKEAEPNVHEINLRVSGWIEKLHADTEGEYIEAGAPLFEFYSPEIHQALSELISLRNRGGHGDALANTAARRLELWGLTPKQIADYAGRAEAPRTVTILSPATGHMLEKAVSEGAGVEAGMTLFKIVDHDLLWMDIALFEMDLPFVELGQPIRATVEADPGSELTGTLDFIYPHVDPATRTTAARLAIPNPGMVLRPGMYATAHLDIVLTEDALLVPREAILDTGARQTAFVALGGGKFELNDVEMGAQSSDGQVEVLSGLAEGDEVVTSGQFLLDTESRLREAVRKFLSDAPAEVSDERAAPPLAAEEEFAEPAVATETTTEADALYTAYLAISARLGAEPGDDSPLDLTALIAAAEALLANQAHGARDEARKLLDAANAMTGQPLEEQRKHFGHLSDAMIALAGLYAPSGAVTPDLYVVHCPMAPGSWIQPGQEVANPYYRDEMKQCGTVERPLPALTEAAS